MISPVFEIGAVRDVPGYGTLYLASRRGEPDKWFEFTDCVDPPHPREKKWVAMISSQFGCAVGCRFCDAGRQGFRGNLTVEELLGQVRYVLSLHPDVDPASVPKLKIHFARMGEPSLNKAVLRALELLGRPGRPPGLMPSLSSVAPRCPLSRSFFDELIRVKDRFYGGGCFQLQFSIHSTDEEARAAIIPIRKWDLAEIAEYGDRWFKPGDRLLTLNFALADPIPFDPAVVERVFPQDRFLIKFTAVHTTQRATENALTNVWYKAPPRIEALGEDLKKRGYQVIINPSWPQEIEGGLSCGQLASSVGDASFAAVA
ncbi:MAG: radical SAM protein [Elusimicrobiota bacterium]